MKINLILSMIVFYYFFLCHPHGTQMLPGKAMWAKFNLTFYCNTYHGYVQIVENNKTIIRTKITAEYIIHKYLNIYVFVDLIGLGTKLLTLGIGGGGGGGIRCDLFPVVLLFNDTIPFWLLLDTGVHPLLITIRVP